MLRTSRPLITLCCTLLCLGTPLAAERIDGIGLVEVTPEGAARFAVLGAVECASWNLERVQVDRNPASGEAELHFDSPGCLVTPPPIDPFFSEFELFEHGEDLDFRRIEPRLGLQGYLEGEITVSSNRTPTESGRFDTRFWLEPLSQGLPPEEEPELRFRLHTPVPVRFVSLETVDVNLRDVRYEIELEADPAGIITEVLALPNPGLGEHQVFVRLGDLGAARQIVVSGEGGGSTCTATSMAHCLNRGRFRVTANWEDFDGGTGPARTIGLSSDSGLFWFFDEDNVELMVKVLDGCSTPFDAYWVFASGLTNVAVDLTVTDTFTGQSWSRSTQLHEEFGPILDTAALSVCP